MKNFKSTILISLFTILTLGVFASAQAACKPAKSYIVTFSGGGYSVAGKLYSNSQESVLENTLVPVAFNGTLTYTRSESTTPYHSTPVLGEGTIQFNADCDMRVYLDWNNLPTVFNTYTDSTVAANGVLIGGVKTSTTGYTGITGGIRISSK